MPFICETIIYQKEVRTRIEHYIRNKIGQTELFYLTSRGLEMSNTSLPVYRLYLDLLLRFASWESYMDFKIVVYTQHYSVEGVWSFPLPKELSGLDIEIFRCQ